MLARGLPGFRSGPSGAVALALLLAWAAMSRAVDAPGDRKPAGEWKVFAECRMATLPQKAAMVLIEEFESPEKADAAWSHLDRMLEDGEATLEADLIVQGSEEKSLVSQSLEELKYATEFEPPRLPQRLSSAEEAPEALKVWPVIGATPTAFGMRTVGETLDLKAQVLYGGAWISVSVNAMHSRLREQAKFDFAELPGGQRLKMPYPQFSHMQSHSSFRLKNGERILLGAHKLANPAKTFELFVLQVKASRVGEKR